MQWSRVKTVLIFLLLAVDVFLLFYIGAHDVAARRRSAEEADNARAVLDSRGVTLPDGMDLTEEEEVQVVLKEIKQTKETLEMTPEDRTEIIEECRARIAVLEEFAPKMMGEEEIRSVIASVLSDMGLDHPTAKDKGKIMKELMPKVKGKADGKLVNELVSTFFE